MRKRVMLIGLQSFLPNERIQYIEFFKAEDFFVINPSDEALKKYADGFKELVMTVDPNVFCNPESYWSVIVEQMEYGQI